MKSVLLAVVVIANVLAAQTDGALAGKITDQRSGEELIGASVYVVGTKIGAATDIEGKFSIKKIPAGTYDIRISFLGYETKTITQVSIAPGAETALNAALSEDQGIQQQEVVISATAIKSGEGALLAERKKATSIGDGISAEQMRRTPDATSGDALKRVTGLSVVDNKFVFIRGASERYNGTMLNGASVSSTEVGKKSFAFDMIPANLLENTIVIKSAAPDLPGDFTGGLVQMNTLDFPESSLLKATVSSGWNTKTTFKSFQRSQGGKKDWLGSDDGSRSLPQFDSDLNRLGILLPNTWAPSAFEAPLNSGLTLTAGNNISLSNESAGDRQIGYIGALSYRTSYQQTEKSMDSYYNGRTLNGTVSNYSVLWGGILNVSYKSGFNKISIKNDYNQSGENDVKSFSGIDLNTTQFNKFTAVGWNERRTYSGILAGEHILPDLNNTVVSWKGSVSSSHRSDPDNKEITYFRQQDASPSDPFNASGDNRRSWSSLNGRNIGYSADLAVPLSGVKLKAGAFYETRTTAYTINYYKVKTNYTKGADDTEPIDIIYSNENFAAGKFSMTNDSKPDDNYRGEQQLFASYMMVDLPFSAAENDFRFTGGARLENMVQKAIVTGAAATTIYPIHNSDILPSANLVYMINESMNLRAAYSQTVNRPEFREIAKSGSYDFIGKLIINGNPDLKRAYVHNYDLRFEIFPEAGEILSVSGFYKKISNAIEEYYDGSLSQAYPTRSWFNSPDARNYGWELEFRKSLRFISSALNGLSVTGNYTRIFSSVEYSVTSGGNSTEAITSTTATRPLQGQSPYMANVAMFYTHPEYGTSINIMYNTFGRRISIIGFNAKDIYEEPRDIVDLGISQPLFSGFEIKFTAKNLLNKDRILTQAEPLSGTIHEFDHSKTGISYSLQLGMTF